MIAATCRSVCTVHSFWTLPAHVSRDNTMLKRYLDMIFDKQRSQQMAGAKNRNESAKLKSAFYMERFDVIVTILGNWYFLDMH